MEGAPHTAKRSMINLCVYGVPPSPVYKGVEEGEGRPLNGVPKGSPTPTGSRIPPFPSWIRRGRKGSGGEGGHPIRIGLGGRPLLGSLLLSPTMAQ